jgi:hypothetical protein
MVTPLPVFMEIEKAAHRGAAFSVHKDFFFDQ